MSPPSPPGGPTLIQDAFLQVVILTKIDIGLYMGQSLRGEGEVGSVIMRNSPRVGARVQPDLKGSLEAHRQETLTQEKVRKCLCGKGMSGTCFSEGLGPAAAGLTQLPIELPQGLARCMSVSEWIQVCQPLHLRQAQLPVGERPPGELACFRWPQPWHTAWGKVQDPEAPGPCPGHGRGNSSNPRLQTYPGPAGHHSPRPASMYVELRAILTGKTLGT